MLDLIERGKNTQVMVTCSVWCCVASDRSELHADPCPPQKTPTRTHVQASELDHRDHMDGCVLVCVCVFFSRGSDGTGMLYTMEILQAGGGSVMP